MLDRIKVFGEAVKNIVLYILTPVVFIVGFIWYLVSQNRELKEKIESKDGEDKLNELKNTEKAVDSSAHDAVTDYERVRKDYLSNSDTSMRQSNTGTEGTDPDQGAGTEPGRSYVKGTD